MECLVHDWDAWYMVVTYMVAVRDCSDMINIMIDIHMNMHVDYDMSESDMIYDLDMNEHGHNDIITITDASLSMSGMCCHIRERMHG